MLLSFSLFIGFKEEGIKFNALEEQFCFSYLSIHCVLDIFYENKTLPA